MRITTNSRVTAWILMLAMMMTLLPGMAITVSADEPAPTIIQSDTKENTNQAGGIIYTKTSTAKSDGTIDITLTAHTTGEVRQMNTVTPTDIVLVLDVSGSMGGTYDSSTVTTYTEVLGRAYTYYTYGWFERIEHTGYGFNNQSRYYINTGTAENPVYTRVSRTGRDANGYEYFEYTRGNTEVYVYPELMSGTATNRSNDYSVYQFYSQTTTTTTTSRMDVLKRAVNSFIDTTETMNTGLETANMHTISIVKFAGERYSNNTTDTPVITEGDGTYTYDGNTYNYSQVVKGLTAVDSTGAAALKAAVGGLSPAGSTAVDKGLALAEAVLMNRSQVVGGGAVDRNEVVIVFTDGEPNYFDGFDQPVANSAIATSGRMKSAADVTVYGVSVAPNADATDLNEDINKFMHYMTSNFPNATDMNTPGADGDMTKGYYMSPDSSTTLTMIFESIIQNIDHPTVTMGEEAAMVDTLSPYFDFQGDVGDVKLQTRERIPDGNGGFTWSTPETDDSLKAEITGDRLTVNGFNFDANFVSETGRGENSDFYGKQLIVSFTVTPDYDVIDIASATLMDGVLPTNSGFAALVDSDSAPAAEVSTPELSAHQVTYKVDDTEYTTYNRFTGSYIEVDAKPTKLGYTFSGWTIDGEEVDPGHIFKMPNEDVEIVGTFTPNRYDVEYVYNTTPVGATDLSGAEYNGNPANSDVAYGSTVTVAPDASAPGYIFNGWVPDDQSVVISNGTFTMPDGPVKLIGSFSPDGNTPYKVIHYTETFEDGVYEIRETETITTDTDATVKAIPKYYLGFTYDDTKVDKISGTVTADPMLVLELYYNRNSYDVTYTYTGDVPQNPPAHPVPETYKYGESVTVFRNVSVDGYTFGGWESLSTTATGGETFEMPNHAVAFVGEFTANTDTAYKVEYYLEDLGNSDVDSDGYTLNDTESYENTGTTGTTVYANAKEFEGFTYYADHPKNKNDGVIAGDGSLILKRYYTRNEYTVTYAYESTEPQPDGAPELTGEDWASETYRFGQTVQVKDDLELTGYDFIGWHSSGYTVDIDTKEFLMPARDVILYGDFEAGEVRWVEKHFFETLDEGVYLDAPDRAFTHHGTTGDPVSAVPIADLVGFELDTSHPRHLPSVSREEGGIEADGTTELRFYYKRIKYTISYVYDPLEQPTGADALLPAEKTYRFGETAEVAARPSLTGYDFVGWYSEQTGVPYEGTFEMPAFNIIYEGDFNPRNDTAYEVHHYLQEADGSYPDTAQHINYHTGITGETVTAVPRIFAGYEPASTDPVTGIVDAEEVLILDLFYVRTKYNVTYYLTGLIPDGFTAPMDTSSPYRHGYEVAVLPIPSNVPSTYIFDGWHSVAQEANEDVVVIDNNKFIMPMHNVRLVGNFTAASNVPYKIRHLTQNEDLSGYDVYREVTNTGSTFELVTAYALVIPGFHNVTTDGSVVVSTQTEQIPDNGILSIDFYYNRNAHKITYQYDGKTPDGAPNLPGETLNVPYGKEVDVEATPNVPGYTFDGWNTEDADLIGGKFKMPDKDVVLKGSFTSNKVDYTVKYWHQNIENDEYTLKEEYTKEAYTGQHVEADGKAYTGFSLNTSKSTTFGHVTVDEDGNGNLVLNLYYDRHSYNVTYGYYGEQPSNAPDLSGKNKTNVRYGTVLDIEAKPVLSGYSFDGWYTRTATVENNKFTMPDHDVAFLGRFIAQYTVSYDLSGGTGASGVSYDVETVDGGTVVDLKAAPTRQDYVFTGWSNGTKIYQPQDDFAVNADVTFTAQWEEDVIGIPDPDDGDGTPDIYQKKITFKVVNGKWADGTSADIVKVVDLKDELGNYSVDGAADISTIIPTGMTANSGYKNGKWDVEPPAKVSGTDEVTYTYSFDRGTTPITPSNKVLYVVEHYKVGTDGSYPTTPTEVENLQGTIGEIATATPKVYDGYALDENISHMTQELVKIERPEDIVTLKLYYDVDEIGKISPDDGDGTPDIYQKKITFKVVNGKWADGTSADIVKVVDLKDELGNYSVDGAADISTIIPTGMTANSGYKNGKWDVEPPAKVSGTDEVTYTYSYTNSGGGGGGGGVTKYTLTYETNGGSAIAKETHNSGKVVKLTKVPVKEGYVLEGWYLDKDLTESVEEVKMTKNITVYASWVKDNGGAGHGYDTPGSLNSEDHFAYIIGFPDGTVRPEANISRAEVTAIFFRLLKPDEIRDKNLTSDNPFTDIGKEDWHNKAISTMAKLNIVKGRAPDVFAPEAYITRAEFATICARFDDSEYEVTDNFTDVKGHWAEADIHEAAAHGWIRGYVDGTFKPDQFITRAEAMTMINRVLNRVPETADDLHKDMIIWPDNSDKTAWYYLAVQEATNSHNFEMKNHIYEKWTAIRNGTDWTKYQ